VVPVKISSGSSPSFTAYAVLAADRNLFVTLINKEHSTGAPDLTVNLAAGEGYSNGRIVFLAAVGGDVAAKTGVTLGGAEIGDDASWAGKWTELAPPKNGQVTVTVPPASAAVVRLTSK
jgi:hypothetical protein